MAKILRLITDELSYYYLNPIDNTLVSKKGYILPKPSGEKTLLVLYDNSSEYSSLLDYSIKNNLGLVIVCNKLPDFPILHKNVVYLEAPDKWLTHTLFFNPTDFSGVIGFRNFSRMAAAFSCFTGYTIPHLKSKSNIDSIIKNIECSKNSILVEITGGVGDHLISIPALKTLASQGSEVSVLCEQHRTDCFYNLPYIRHIYCKRNEIDVSKFNKIIVLHFGQLLNDYRLELNKQNRIYSVAEVCGLKKESLVIDRPEIILTKDEISNAERLYKPYKNRIFAGVDSARVDAMMPSGLAQTYITKLNKAGFTVFTSSSKPKNFEHCIDLNKKLSLRQLFAVISVMDCVLTVDTSFLHIAAAFNKKTFAFLSYFHADWRCSTYHNCDCYYPNVKCFPCIAKQFVAVQDQCCHTKSCYEFFNQDVILSDITNYKTAMNTVVTIPQVKSHIINKPQQSDIAVIKDSKKRILFSRWDIGLGDWLILTAGLKSLRAVYTEHIIVIGCLPRYADLFKNNPYVDEIITNKDSINNADYDRIIDASRFFEHEHYPQNGIESRTMSRVDMLYRDLLRIPAVDKRPLYYISEEEIAKAKQTLSLYSHAKTIVTIHLASNAAARNYPLEYFYSLQSMLFKANITTVLIGPKQSAPCGFNYDNIKLPGLINLTGLNLRETSAIINESDLLIAVDSSYYHIATALGKKSLVLFGGIKPQARLLYYDDAFELFSAGLFDNKICPCNDALWLGACIKACKLLEAGGQPSLCMFYHVPKKVFKTALMLLDKLPKKCATSRPRLSFAMMTHNEEAMIEQCIKNIYDIADEIVVIDDSTDNTRKILRKFKKVKVYSMPDIPCPSYCNYCKENNINLQSIGRPCSAKLRQYSFSKCTGDWIFRLDADEMLSTEDLIRLRYLIDYSDDFFPGVKIFWCPTVNFFLDDNHYKTGAPKGSHAWFPDYHKRLHKNEKRFHKWVQPAHERMVDFDSNGKIKFLDDIKEFPFQHFTNWFKVFHYGYLQPKKDRLIDAKKYEKMNVLLHILDDELVEPWVWKKPTNIKLPDDWGKGVCEYNKGERG